MRNIKTTGTENGSNSRPLLSIVIPTHNRQEYAASAIRCALAIPSDDIEIVVQDCSDNDLLSSLVASAPSDRRLSYHYERPAHMTENWNRAIGRATGEYVCLIGDDDGVNPEILQAAGWAKSAGVDCLAVKSSVDYWWPGATAHSTFSQQTSDGYLQIYPFRGDITTDVDPEAEILKLIRDGGVYYLQFRLPKLYHGLVHHRCLEAVRDKTGAYTGGLSPEMFASLAIACTAPRLAVIDYPLTIPGACKASNSVIYGVLKRSSAKLEDKPEFRDTGYCWSELIPRVYTVPPVWADSAVAALLAMGRDDLVGQLNLPKLAAYSLRANRGVTKPVLQGLFGGLRTMRQNIATSSIKLAWYLLWMLGGIVIGPIKRLTVMFGLRRPSRIDGLSNMVDVSEALSRYLNDNGWSFAQCVLKSYKRK